MSSRLPPPGAAGEYDTGQTTLAELDAKQLDPRQTLRRIAGAVQVLEELLGEEAGP
jgi:hypothetical protein